MNPIVKDGITSTICSMVASTVVYPINAIKVEFTTLVSMLAQINHFQKRTKKVFLFILRPKITRGIN